MDMILDIVDTHVLDAVYTRLLPVSSFLPRDGILSNVTQSTAAAASSIYSYIPHPPLPPLAAAFASSQSAWPRNYLPRQLISLFVLTYIGILFLYFSIATMSYYLIFDKRMEKHPRFLKNQVKMEIESSLQAFPLITLMTVPWFAHEINGGGKYYDRVDEYGWAYMLASIPLFLLFTDFGIYLVHRTLHNPMFYKRLHKPHHKWVIPTPFASHAFHPIDGYLQSVPYHMFAYVFPLHKKMYLALFTFVNFWSIFIHDSDMITGHPLENVINGPAHHTVHHIHFVSNYGQYFTFADRLGGSYRHPLAEYDPMLEVKKVEALAKEKKIE